jgi:hypothetical protein
MLLRTLIASSVLLAPAAVLSQDHEHRPGMTHTEATPTQPGQATFAAIAEIVKILMADPTTDWSKVNIGALREHLIDMDDVTMRAQVRQESIPGGARFTVTGTGRVAEAIRRMSAAHGAMVATDSTQRVTVEQVPGGARMSVAMRDPNDAAAVARIRALGFHGMLTTGDHHGPHHLALARGTPPAGHAH